MPKEFYQIKQILKNPQIKSTAQEIIVKSNQILIWFSPTPVLEYVVDGRIVAAQIKNDPCTLDGGEWEKQRDTKLRKYM